MDDLRKRATGVRTTELLHDLIKNLRTDGNIRMSDDCEQQLLLELLAPFALNIGK